MRITAVPTWKQMLVLVDRTERGLTPAEAARLRAGVRHFASARRTAGQLARHRAAQAEAERDYLAAVVASLTGQTTRQAVADARLSVACSRAGRRLPVATKEMAR